MTIEETKKASDSNFSIKQNSTYDWVGNTDNTHDFHAVEKNINNRPNNNDDFDFMYDGIMAGELHEPEVAVNEENDTVADELHLCETKEDDFEIFNLRIIHRKNRFVCKSLVSFRVSSFLYGIQSKSKTFVFVL